MEGLVSEEERKITSDDSLLIFLLKASLSYNMVLSVSKNKVWRISEDQKI